MTTVNPATGEILAGESLLERYDYVKQCMADIKTELGLLEMQIHAEIAANGGTAIPSENFICELTVSNSYDHTMFVPILEELNQSELNHCHSEEWTEQVVHQAAFNTTKLKGVVNKRGGRAKELFEKAQIPGEPKLKFERIEAGG
jgi:hypothetical protein